MAEEITTEQAREYAQRWVAWPDIEGPDQRGCGCCGVAGFTNDLDRESRCVDHARWQPLEQDEAEALLAWVRDIDDMDRPSAKHQALAVAPMLGLDHAQAVALVQAALDALPRVDGKTREEYIETWWRRYVDREGGPDRTTGHAKSIAGRRFDERLREDGPS